MIETIIKLITKIIGLLPADPFTEYIDSVAAFFTESGLMGYINYFIPINMFVSISQKWIIAVGMYIVVRTIVKGLKGGRS